MASPYIWKDTLKGAIQIYEAPNYDALVKAVVDGRRKLGKPTNYNRVYNELRKLNNPKPARKLGAPEKGKLNVAKLGLEHIANGVKAFAKTTILGDKVSQDEILRRAAICEKCPKLEMMSGCNACGAGRRFAALYEASRSLFKGQRYHIPEKLAKANCGVCKCYLANMLPAKIEVFKEDDAKMAANRPNACWLKNR